MNIRCAIPTLPLSDNDFLVPVSVFNLLREVDLTGDKLAIELQEPHCTPDFISRTNPVNLYCKERPPSIVNFVSV